MFQRYTEKARRVVFFARYEASQVGSPLIEPEHLLLGILREDKTLTNQLLRSHASVESIRKQIELNATVREKVSTAVDLPLSDPSKRVLAYAAEEAESLSHKHIGSAHLLLGLLREEKCFAAEILHQRGLHLPNVREEIARTGEAPTPRRETPLLDECSRDLTRAAIEGELDGLIGRRQELDGIVEILSSRNKRNPVLIGDHGVGKTAIVEGLAQRIADGEVPSFLEDKRILAMDLAVVIAGTKHRGQFEDRLKGIVKELMDSQDSIIFIDELGSLAGPDSAPGSLDAPEMLKFALLRGEIQCIATSTPTECRKLIQSAPWLGHCFRAVDVPALGNEEILLVLQSRKRQYEKFHEVTYSDDAVRYAAQYCAQYFPDNALPKGMELLDAAGARLKLRQSSPDEVLEIQKRIKFIRHRAESAIASQEFEKAGFYSEEERKEREKLTALREKYHLDESAGNVVGREEIENVVSRWGGPSTAAGREEPATGAPSPLPTAAGSAPGPNKAAPSVGVFMCHSSEDKPAVRDLYRRLKDNQIEPWLDEENLLPGQEWDYEITKAVRSSHVVIVCLSTHSVSKSGYLQREIKEVLDIADQQPQGTIYVIPVKLEECEVPDRLRRWHWVNLFETKGFEKLMHSLRERARALEAPQRNPNLRAEGKAS